MQKFVDRVGRIWIIEIDVAAIKRVRNLAGINLLAVVEGDLIDRLMSDPVALCDCLYAVCQPQAARDAITEEEFGRGLAGDVIAEATAALLEGLVAFFPEPRRRLLQKAAAKYQDVMQKAMTLVEQRLSDPRLETRIMKELEKQLALDNSDD